MLASILTLEFSTTAVCCRARTSHPSQFVETNCEVTGTNGPARQHRRGWRTTQRLAPGDAAQQFLTASFYETTHNQPQDTGAEAAALQTAFACAPQRQSTSAVFHHRRHPARNLRSDAQCPPISGRRSDPAFLTSRGAGTAKVRARGLVCVARSLAAGSDRGTRSSSALPSGGRLRTGSRADARSNAVPPLSWTKGRSSLSHTSAASFPHAPMPTSLRPTVALDVLVPLSNNLGVPFPDSLFAAFEHRVVDLAGGITRRGDVEGIWRRPNGTMQRERSRSYVTTVDAAVVERVASDLDVLVRTTFQQIASFIQATPTTATVF